MAPRFLPHQIFTLHPCSAAGPRCTMTSPEPVAIGCQPATTIKGTNGSKLDSILVAYQCTKDWMRRFDLLPSKLESMERFSIAVLIQVVHKCRKNYSHARPHFDRSLPLMDRNVPQTTMRGSCSNESKMAGLRFSSSTHKTCDLSNAKERASTSPK